MTDWHSLRLAGLPGELGTGHSIGLGEFTLSGRTGGGYRGGREVKVLS